MSRAGASVAHPRAHPRSLLLRARSECLGGRRIAATTLQEHLIATLTAPRLHEGSISHRMTSLPSAPASNPFLKQSLDVLGGEPAHWSLCSVETGIWLSSVEPQAARRSSPELRHRYRARGAPFTVETIQEGDS